MVMEEDKFFDRKLVVTEDGSSSIFLPQFNEHYHSSHGAIQESKHVFMKMGWEKIIPGKSLVHILEIGFGTGLNAWLVLQEARKKFLPQVFYSSLEAFPVSIEMAAELNYASTDEKSEFMALHAAQWNTAVKLNPKFTVEKLKTSLADFIPLRTYDLVFFDAFAPNVQPEMWTKEVFDKLFAATNSGGILVTYCSKGEARRNMIASGFTVEKVPGPPGKREMLRATKSLDHK
jgi:tRNA U34 5-methylaminomethyl-2-thiouridine-forming methyltransferase MnmC